MTIETHREAETEAVAERIARLARPGLVVCLAGPLGAGKTAFVRGLARGLGIDERAVHSPTFVTAVEHRGRLPLHHLDLYRHDEVAPPADWLAEILDGDGVAAVEWSERLGEARPADALDVAIVCGPGDEDRRIDLRATGPASAAVLAGLGAEGRTPGRAEPPPLEAPGAGR